MSLKVRVLLKNSLRKNEDGEVIVEELNASYDR
ncbi:hypothetical protein [Pseudogracilibacillus sp. SO30301A]